MSPSGRSSIPAIAGATLLAIIVAGASYGGLYWATSHRTVILWKGEGLRGSVHYSLGGLPQSMWNAIFAPAYAIDCHYRSDSDFWMEGMKNAPQIKVPPSDIEMIDAED